MTVVQFQPRVRRASCAPPSAIVHFLADVMSHTRGDKVPHTLPLDARSVDYNGEAANDLLRIGHFFVAAVNATRQDASAADMEVISVYPAQYARDDKCVMLFAITLAESVCMGDFDVTAAQRARPGARVPVQPFLDLFASMFEAMAEHVRRFGVDEHSDALPKLFASMLATSGVMHLFAGEDA